MQIQEDKECKAAAAATTRENTEATCQAVLLKLAESELAVKQAEEDVHKNTTRPDLRYVVSASGSWYTSCSDASV